MALRRVKSRNKKNKLTPIPHNNRAKTRGRSVVKQEILVDSTIDPTKKVVKTIFHQNLSAYEQRLSYRLKSLLESEDITKIQELKPYERNLFNKLLKATKETNEQ